MRTPICLLLALLLLAPATSAQTTSSEPTTPSDTPDRDRGDDDAYEGPQGQAEGAPMWSGLIVGVLFIGILSLLFAGYLRYRDD